MAKLTQTALQIRPSDPDQTAAVLLLLLAPQANHNSQHGSRSSVADWFNEIASKIQVDAAAEAALETDQEHAGRPSASSVAVSSAGCEGPVPIQQAGCAGTAAFVRSADADMPTSLDPGLGALQQPQQQQRRRRFELGVAETIQERAVVFGASSVVVSLAGLGRSVPTQQAECAVRIASDGMPASEDPDLGALQQQ